MSAVADIRPLHWRDLAELATLERQLFPTDAWTEQTWWAELAQRPRRVYLAAHDRTADPAVVVGYAGLDLAGSTADVMTLAVHPAYRGSGLADRLLDRLVAEAGASGAQALLLEVRADNEPALRLYARHGFGRISVRPRYYQPGDVDAHVLRRSLS